MNLSGESQGDRQPFWLKPYWCKPFLSNFPLFSDGRRGRARVVVSPRKGWNLEEDISRAVWKRILMGSRPPSARWAMKEEPTSPAPTPSKLENTQRKMHQKVMPKSKAESIQAAISALGPDPDSTFLFSLREALQKAKDVSGKPENPRQETGKSPDERVEEAEARVARFEAALELLGVDSPDAEPIKVAREDNVVFCLLRKVSILV